MAISGVDVMRRVLLIAVFLALPGTLWAQAGPTPSPGSRASPTGGVMLKGSRMVGKSRIHFGGWAGLVFGGSLTLGGGGFSLLEDVELAGSEAGTGFDLGMGYGGILLRYARLLSPRITGEVGALMGGGHAEIRDRLVGTEVGSDNFVVVEPEIAASFHALPLIHVGAALGYRMTWGMEDLPRVSEENLRSFTATLFLRFGGIQGP